MFFLKRLLVLLLALTLFGCTAPAPTVTPVLPTVAPPVTVPPTKPLASPIPPTRDRQPPTPATKDAPPASPTKPAQPTTTVAPTKSAPPSPTSAPAALKRPTQPQIGLNFIRFYWDNGRAIGLNTTTPYVQPDAIFKDFRDLGAQTFRQFVKADLLWNVVEPQDNQWNWQTADVVLKSLDFEPIVTLFALQYASPTPPWATTPAQFQKTLGPEATDYIRTVVQRYAPYVKYWELGNEMDHWRAANPGENTPQQEKLPAARPADGFSPREQGVFLAQAAALIRQYDPDAVIVMPGLSGLDDYCTNTWLSGVIEGGGKGWFDVVNYHYYPSWERYSLLRPQFGETLKRLGVADKPVWLTETGSTASPTLTIRTNYPNSPESQAADIFRRIVPAWGHGDALVQWHTYIGSDDEEWRLYGIRTSDGKPQPSLSAFKLLTQELIPFQRVEKLTADAKGVNAYKITTQTGAIRFVAWGNGNYTVPAGVTQMVSVVPPADGRYTWQPTQPGKAIALSANPVLFR